MNKFTVGTAIWLVGLLCMIILLINNLVHLVNIDSNMYNIIFVGAAVVSVIGAFVRSNASKG